MSGNSSLYILFATALILPTVSALVGALIVWPPADRVPLPWYERARLNFPAKVGPVINILVIAEINFFTLITEAVTLRMSVRPIDLVFATAASFAGPVLIAFWLGWRASARRRPIGRWMVGCICALIFRFFNVPIYVGFSVAFFLLPHDFVTVSSLLLLAAALMAFNAWGGNILFARVIGLAQPALPRTERAADWAAERVGIRPRAVYEMRWPIVRVDGFVFSQFLVFTDTAAELLSDDELLAQSIRELTFFKQRWLAGILRVGDSFFCFMMLSSVAIAATFGGAFTILIGSLAGMSGGLLLRPLLRRVHLRADALAAESAIDPLSALRALERQLELNLQPIVTVSKNSPNAHLYDRLTAAGIAPPYPRPRPPSKGRIIACIAAGAATEVVLSVMILIGGSTLAATFL